MKLPYTYSERYTKSIWPIFPAFLFLLITAGCEKPPEEVINLSILARKTSATLSWRQYSEGVSHMSIHYGEGVETGIPFTGEIKRDSDKKILHRFPYSATITGLRYEARYTFLIKTVGENGKVSDGVKIGPLLLADFTFKSVAAGHHHTLLLQTNGTLHGTGMNKHGQLRTEGNSTRKGRYPKMADGVKSIWAQSFKSLILMEDDTLHLLHDPAKEKLAEAVKTASLGQNHVLFIKNDDTLWAWGNNNFGKAGDGSGKFRIETPVQIAEGVVAASAGDQHSFFVKKDNTVWSVGRNGSGELGNGTDRSAGRFTQVKIRNAIAVSAGYNHSLFLKKDGSLWGAGGNGNGQLGLKNKTKSFIPLKLMDGVKEMAAGNFVSLVLKHDNTLWGFGLNSGGMLGKDHPRRCFSPVLIAKDVETFALGNRHLLYIRTDGVLSTKDGHTCIGVCPWIPTGSLPLG